jgi:dCTP deaminase
LRTSKRKSELEQQIKKSTTTWLIQPEEYFVLHPGEFALASTLEFICLPDDIAGRLEGRSTWGRLGLQIHATAGFVDPGFRGSLTFELINSGKLPIKLSPGLRLGQICFFRVHEVQVNYKMKKRSKYADQTGVVPCKAPEEPEVGS